MANIQVSKNKEVVNVKVKTAQQWMMLVDVKEYCAYRKDNAILGFIRIMPKNIELLSANEVKRFIQSCTEAYSSISRSFQLFCIGRPADLGNYVEWLSNIHKNETNFLKRRILNKIIQHNSNLASSGEVVERRYYLLVPFKDKNDNEVAQAMDDISKSFNAADLDTGVCSYDDILDLLLLFSQPTQAVVDKTSFEVSDAPIWEL